MLSNPFGAPAVCGSVNRSQEISVHSGPLKSTWSGVGPGGIRKKPPFSDVKIQVGLYARWIQPKQ